MSHTKEYNNKKSKSSHSTHHHHHHHHHGSSKHYRKKEYDPTSEMERRGQNIIYDSVRKERVNLMIKRSAFVIFAIAITFILFYFMKTPSEKSIDLFSSNATKEEVNVLKNKIVNYEYYIEELEERLSKYEEVDSIFEKK